MAAPTLTPALFFHPDGYDLAHGKLMGRQSAGYGFLRAAVAGRGDGPVVGYGRSDQFRGDFERLVKGIDPAAEAEWLSAPTGAAALKRRRVLHRADPILTTDARLRLRAGPAAYSLTGVTHTLASWSPLEAFAAALTEPLEPWDAIICTSQAAAEVARKVQEAELDYLRWRLGGNVRASGPQFPVIPLGVHTADFEIGGDQRKAAREAFGIAPDEVVILYVGRLMFHSKAHPYPVFRAVQAIVEQGAVKPVLAFYGQAPNTAIDAAFRQAAAEYAPWVRTVFIDGAKVDPREAWACGDIFCSLSDGIQETFGLTPVEAMACGLPCVVTSWNGYRETVRDRVDGFHVQTWAPAPGSGPGVAEAYEFGSLSYDRYTWATTASTAVDLSQLVGALSALLADADLRRRMGESGKARARDAYDWARIYDQYGDLWGELDRRREHALSDPDELARLRMAPRGVSAYPDPFTLFSHYSSALITPSTRARLIPGATAGLFARLTRGAMFRNSDLGDEALGSVWAQVLAGAHSPRSAAVAAGRSDGEAIRAFGLLAKMGLIAFEND
jgi:glycosyltransferase involved in cell wall biosynthesis